MAQLGLSLLAGLLFTGHMHHVTTHGHMHRVTTHVTTHVTTPVTVPFAAYERTRAACLAQPKTLKCYITARALHSELAATEKI
jgi:hypothetical protein